MLRAATRGSALARWQTERVVSLLGDDVELVVVETEGDRRTDVAIDKIGGRGVFVKEVQAAVLDGRADFAVHSAKDLPSDPALQPDGLLIAAIPERADARDALVGCTLDELPAGALVGTDSVRRRAQLAHLRPDLTFSGLRGNVDTRLAKASSYDAIVLAAAGVHRLGREDAIAQLLDVSVMVPQVAQGALAVECRVDDEKVRAKFARIEDEDARKGVDAERAFLAELGGACDLPVGAHATVTDGVVRIDGLLATADGRIALRATCEGDDPVAVGAELARCLLDDAGGSALLQ